MPAPRPDARSTERPELQTARKSWGHHHPSASVMMTLFPAIRQRTLWIFAAVEARRARAGDAPSLRRIHHSDRFSPGARAASRRLSSAEYHLRARRAEMFR